MAQYSIIIANGDRETLQYLSGTLIANGFESMATSSGADALDLYKEESPDLVVVDMVLSDMNGMQLLEGLKKYDSNARVIITTAYADKESVARAFRMGALEFLEKPLDPAFFIEKIQDLLAREDRALEGNLKMMSLASIIQINCEERNRAQLTLNHQGNEGTIFFQDGEMIHAESGNLSGEDAIYSLLTWENGSFQVKMGLEPESRTIDKPWSGLLLEGMRRIDESTAGWTSEWEEENIPPHVNQGSDVPEKISKAICSHRDVQSSLIISPDGTIITQEQSEDPDGESNLAVFIQEKADLIGSLLEAGVFERAVLTGSNKRMYLQSLDDSCLVLSLSVRSSAESVFESINMIQKRYQAA